MAVHLFLFSPFVFMDGSPWPGFFLRHYYPLKQYFPGSLTRNLYRKKIPEIMKIVDKSALGYGRMKRGG